MDRLKFGELAQVRDVLTATSNTKFVAQSWWVFGPDIQVLSDHGGAQFEDVGACLKLFWGHVIFLLFRLHVQMFSKFHHDIPLYLPF